MQDFQQFIFDWWKENKRDLPWRHTRDPYKILVSEVMLQQTQVPRVIPKYTEFIRVFPTVSALAKTSPASVLRAWKGMGYNRRALYLHKAAKLIVEKYKGKFPVSEQKLSQIPGLGIYTIRAILVFAFHQDVAMVDTNIRQILTHFFFNGRPQKESIIQEVADRLFPKGQAWEWHQALMDFGALELKNLRRISSMPVRQRSTRLPPIPFRQTNRFLRGRLIDALREKDEKRNVFIQQFAAKFGKSNDVVQQIIEGLKKDGLVVYSHPNTISLPK